MGYCDKYGAKLEEGMAFCTGCGAQVNKENQGRSKGQTIQVNAGQITITTMGVSTLQ